MKKNIKKKTLLTMSVALLLSVAVGVTLAYILTKTEPVENTFNPSKVACAVVENGSATENTDGIVENRATKTDVKIKNTGDTDAYIRVAVVVNWMSDNGTKVWATKPVKSIDGTDGDYTITYNLKDNGWIDGGDGYYYYTQPVAKSDLTDILITSATQLTQKGPVGTDNTQYYLSIEIVASAIQANGMGAASARDAWTRAQQSANND